MLLEDDIRLLAGLHGWKVALRRLHPDNEVDAVVIYRRRHCYCLGLLGELQRMSVEQFVAFILTYAERETPTDSAGAGTATEKGQIQRSK